MSASQPTNHPAKQPPILLPNVGTAAWAAMACAALLILAGVLPGFAVERFNQVGASLQQSMTASSDAGHSDQLEQSGAEQIVKAD